LTAVARARVLSRFGQMRFRSFTSGFVPMLSSVRAKNPEELNDALRQMLLAASKGTPKS
jgi:hypothetical protein